ncbi:MAG: exopolyphosphatase [Frankiales bacterium]|nr:exopolyphosphatase [Frankiales bacterium]
MALEQTIEPRPVRIANISGFYGDRRAAASDIVRGPERVDVLTGDYLAELTMLLLWKQRRKDPVAGYARTFLAQMEDVLGECLDRGIRVVVNAGGVNPHGCAEALRELARRTGLSPQIAVVEGDDLLPRVDELQRQGCDFHHLDTGAPLSSTRAQLVTAHAYLGAFGIARGLAADADVVITGRVTDASLVVGTAAWWHGWKADDLDALAGAVVAGHVIECGPQATGGNYCFQEELPDLRYPGFPIAEVAADGSAVITKQPGTGGAVTVGTVTAQLLYEIQSPAYAGPDVVARLDTTTLTQVGPDRVQLSGTRGEPPSGELKVALNLSAGWRNTMGLMIVGLDREAKARRAIAMLGEVLGGWEQFADVDLRQVGDELRVTVKDPDHDKVGRRFSGAVIELLLASYAGAWTTTPPSDAVEYGVYWPALVPAAAVEHAVVLPDGTREVIPAEARGAAIVPQPQQPAAWLGTGPVAEAALGEVAGGRSGDKGGNANVGLWTREDASYSWMVQALTVERFVQLLPEAAGLEVRRHVLPNLRALNFVVVGLLGEGVASSTRPDPQAKGLAEQVRAARLPIPMELLR